MVSEDGPKVNRPPAFQLYARDWLVDTAHLSLEDQGAYMRLLCHQWIEGPLPSNREELARRLGLKSRRMTQFDRLWSRIGHHFPTIDGSSATENDNHSETSNERGSMYLANRWLEAYRAEIAAHRELQSAK